MSKHKNYPVRIPRQATGIRSQELRTSGGQSWWMRRWQDRLAEMGLNGRLGRARNYAQSGQVVDLRISNSHIEAEILGVRLEPYRVTIDFTRPSPAVHRRICRALQAEPMLVARLLANDLPSEVELIFRKAGCCLFPGGKLGEHRYDMTTACTCPDYANPCKHALAVLILLGEEIARRPLALLELRGVRVEDLCNED